MKVGEMCAGRFGLVCGAMAVAVVTAVALGGCQAQSTAAASARSTMTVTVTSKKTESAAPAKPASSAAPKIVAPPTTPCATSGLSVVPASRHVTIGVQIEEFTLTTSDPAGCTLTGPMNLTPKGPLSAQVPNMSVDLAVSQQQWPDDLDVQPSNGVTVPLLPGKTASFYLAWFAASSPPICEPSNGFGFNAPGDTTYGDMHVVSYPIGPICDGVFYVSVVF